MAAAPQDAVEEPHLNSADETTDNASKHQRNGTDPDAQEMVISSLRSQIQDLFSQVTQLNTKLVKSYDRVSDLEDDLHVASSNIRSSTLKISQLELERTQHLSALNTGLLVEKSHVTAELTRLMEKATEEAAQRGQAESARADIEKDLDDLSASLFDQANTMVAEARYGKALSERKVEEAEQALKGAEEAVTIMQQQMQMLQAEKEQVEKSAQNMQVVMGKGKWVERQEGTITPSIRLLGSHVPYQEFLLFIAHLRSIHPTSSNPPAMSTLLPLPFLARLLTEDSEPTVRLDLAPSLNWLSRRSVLSAIHNGQLTIEPMSSTALLLESSYASTSTIPGLNSSGNNISCALCGTPIFSTPNSNSQHISRTPTHPMRLMTQSHSHSNSWSTSLFKKPLPYSNSANNSPSPVRLSRSTDASTLQHPHPPQIHIFRLASPSAAPISSLPSSLPLSISTSSFTSSGQSQPPQHPHIPNPPLSPTSQATIYPLCTNGWCLARLRSTCTLWAFVRTGIVEKVWEEEVPSLPPTITPSNNGEKPPVPPRRRGLWGMASALGERAASWNEDKKTQQEKDKQLPARPPPVHPTVAAGEPKIKRRVPPPLPKRSEGRANVSPTARKPVPNINDSPTISGTATPDEAKPHPPVSPTLVVLPESRPSTPVIAPPSRTASPAPVAGAAPPPLPRRALARGSRPISAVGADARASSRPTTPSSVPAPDHAPEPVAETTEGKGEAKAKDSAASAATDIPITDSEAKAELTSKPVTQPETATPSSEGAKVDSDEPPAPTVNGDTTTGELGAGQKSRIAEVNGVSTSGLQMPGAKEPGVSEAGTHDVVASGLDGEVKGRDEKEEVGVPLDPVEKHVNGVESTEKDEEVVKMADKEQKEEDEEVYVGDATWEERTWKELVRLREEMYWARVGGVK